ncbi:MAG: hypothetical protein GXY83_37775 [Rhodopirellula sp.]|nr:hypothetical protein [Rhodopirellula sp.]
MTNSYLGIVTPRGLETLVVETEHAAPFLLRRVARRPFGEVLALWAVLDDRTAHDLTQQITGGRFDDALRELDARALHLGTLLPPLQEDHRARSVR